MTSPLDQTLEAIGDELNPLFAQLQEKDKELFDRLMLLLRENANLDSADKCQIFLCGAALGVQSLIYEDAGNLVAAAYMLHNELRKEVTEFNDIDELDV